METEQQVRTGSEHGGKGSIHSEKKGEGKDIVKRSDLIPRSKTAGYTKEFVAERREWVARKTGASLDHVSRYSVETDELKSRVENLVGAVQVPLGISGPLLVNGEHAQGLFYIPFATTEGTLVETYQRGMFAITMSGGANVRVIKESLSFSPLFIFKGLADASYFIQWVAEHFPEIKAVAESTTRHGKLLEIVPYSIGRRVILDFRYHTGDAMGLNMVSIATATACNYILERVDAENFYLASNLSSDKKASYFNLITGYGKQVSVEVEFTKESMLKYFGISPEDIYTYWCNAFLGAHLGGMMSFNCHFANALAALYIACGQDVAQIVNASVGITHSELTATGGFRVSLRLPGIIVGTIGGGTMSGTAKECLELLGCSGPNKALKFAEIIGATLLAGEVAIGAAIASNTFISAHIKRRNASKSTESAVEYAEV